MEFPEPTDCSGVSLVREEALVPHSNQASVADPLGFTEPFNVAPPAETPVAEDVDTVGGSGAAEVEKLDTVPLTVPALFDAAMR